MNSTGPALATPPQKLSSPFHFAAKRRAASEEGRLHLERMRQNSLRVRQSKKLSGTPI